MCLSSILGSWFKSFGPNVERGRISDQVNSIHKDSREGVEGGVQGAEATTSAWVWAEVDGLLSCVGCSPTSEVFAVLQPATLSCLHAIVHVVPLAWLTPHPKCCLIFNSSQATPPPERSLLAPHCPAPDEVSCPSYPCFGTTPSYLPRASVSLSSPIDCELTKNVLQCLAQSRYSGNTHGVNDLLNRKWGDREVSIDIDVSSAGD